MLNDEVNEVLEDTEESKEETKEEYSSFLWNGIEVPKEEVEKNSLRQYLNRTKDEAYEMIEEYILGATKGEVRVAHLELLEKRKQARERLAFLMEEQTNG